ncbi:MAG: VOC family protein [Rubrivivax sp.]|nr:VOC family protein [Rubrivivax sp.]
MKEYADVYKTPGAFSWTELMTTDPQAASAFYGKLFGWGFDEMNMSAEMGVYRVAKVGDTAVGGIMKTPAPAAGMPPMWCAYVTVADIEATLKQATALGGKVVAPVMEVPNVGRFAVVADPQGATINVMQYSMPG